MCAMDTSPNDNYARLTAMRFLGIKYEQKAAAAAEDDDEEEEVGESGLSSRSKQNVALSSVSERRSSLRFGSTSLAVGEAGLH